MESSLKCESCGMPVEEGKYCVYCVDENGKLQSFEERFLRMVEWLRGSEPSLTRAEAEIRVREHMLHMPAWKDHPKLQAN